MTFPSETIEVHTSMTLDALADVIAAAASRETSVDRISQSRIVVAATDESFNAVIEPGRGHPQHLSVPVLAPYQPASVRITPGPAEEDLAEAAELVERIRAAAMPFSSQELDALIDSMPLLSRVATHNPAEPGWRPDLSAWAVIWRDHFVEDTLASLLALVKLGVDPRFIMGLDKGDSTAKPERIAATFRHLNMTAGVFDNNYVSKEEEGAASRLARARIIKFADAAHAVHKRVLVVDDGLIVLNCFADDQRPLDAVIELTRSGLKRLARVPLTVPLYDLARSDVKQRLTYDEITESCVRRIQELTGENSSAGRHVVLVGYGSLGRRMTARLNSLGAIVHVVDTNDLALLEAAHHGFQTSESAAAAIAQAQPHLLLGCTGEPWLTWELLELLPDKAVVAAVATADLACLTAPPRGWERSELPEVGAQWYSKETQHRFVQLGEGRSINLYRSEAVPNGSIDLYKAAIAVASVDLCGRVENRNIGPGIHTDEVNEALASSPIYRYARAIC